MKFIVIDTNCSADFFLRRGIFGDCLEKIIEKTSNIFVTGGRLYREQNAIVKIRSILLELGRSGRARRYDDVQVNELERVVAQDKRLNSDDPHVIALGKISNARHLVSLDIALHKDWKNKHFIDSPRGTVITSAIHRRILETT